MTKVLPCFYKRLLVGMFIIARRYLVAVLIFSFDIYQQFHQDFARGKSHKNIPVLKIILLRQSGWMPQRKNVLSSGSTFQLFSWKINLWNIWNVMIILRQTLVGVKWHAHVNEQMSQTSAIHLNSALLRHSHSPFVNAIFKWISLNENCYVFNFHKSFKMT